ncbi:MAG: QueT transporter family protein [Ruminococcaceae bacterium]|nr:QueT transporter family protein [Oscillospiraceae bacterium]
MKLKKLTKTAIIAALYSVLTLTLAPVSFGILQLRVSEVLTVLPKFSKSSIWGLTLGCLLSNYIGMAIMNTAGIIDVVFGTLATLLAAICSYLVRKSKWLVPLFPTLFNGIIVGGYLHFIAFKSINIFLCMLFVALGEGTVTYIIGIPFMNFIMKHKKIGEILND